MNERKQVFIDKIAKGEELPKSLNQTEIDLCKLGKAIDDGRKEPKADKLVKMYLELDEGISVGESWFNWITKELSNRIYDTAIQLKKITNEGVNVKPGEHFIQDLNYLQTDVEVNGKSVCDGIVFETGDNSYINVIRIPSGYDEVTLHIYGIE